ncbi:hypothetical protein QVD99_000515 [Batrachochytrium dendrobatidis]|nr:hypothetical protein O5D80_008094 [Batrachochytrium dendrobatidis]KAK5673042.1 hypothetical protein QVD99_000515 [Batrachochytrium dendrobatidis]
MDSNDEEADIVLSMSMPAMNQIMSSEDINRRRTSNCPTLADEHDWSDADQVQQKIDYSIIPRNTSFGSISAHIDNLSELRHASLDELKSAKLDDFQGMTNPKVGNHNTDTAEGFKKYGWFATTTNRLVMGSKDKHSKDEKKSLDELSKYGSSTSSSALSKKMEKRYGASSSNISDISLRGSFGTIFNTKGHHRTHSDRKKGKNACYLIHQVSSDTNLDPALKLHRRRPC